MKTGIYLSYKGLGANLLHLSYCHQIAKKYGPVTIITLCKNLEEAYLRVELLEHVAKIDFYAASMGPVMTLPEADLQKLLEKRAKLGLGPKASNHVTKNILENYGWQERGFLMILIYV